MRIRTQLLVAFLLLSVVPLTAIVLYSYSGSTRALKRASEEEGARLTRDMNSRLASVREELGAAVARTGEIPAPLLVKVFNDDPEAARAVAEKLGEAAPFLESFAFTPEAGAPAAPPIPDHVDVDKIIASIRAAPIPPAAKAQAEREVRESLKRSEQEIADSRQAMEAEEEMRQQELRLDAQASAAVPPAPAPPATAPDPQKARELEQKARELEALSHQHRTIERRIEATQRAVARSHAKLILGHDLQVPVVDEGKVIGTIDVQVRGDQIVHSILGSAAREGEIPYAVDRKGKLYTVQDSDRSALEPIRGALDGAGRRVRNDWVIASTKDPESGLTYGIARPLGEPLRELRRTAGRNFVAGLALIGLALMGMVPMANHITRDLDVLRLGADRIAEGHLDTRVPVRSKNEIGQLAETFNAMARDLEVHQAEETHRRLMEAEYARKSDELEEARRFQLSLLPKSVPIVPPFEVAVTMRTATEVGGDYYDFRVGVDGSLTAAVGDATGHGARAATMVTIVKSLFSAADLSGGDPSSFLEHASAAVRKMELERMTMAFALARFIGTEEGARLTIASAAMPPALVCRAATGAVEEIAIEGVPLGTITMKYEERTVELARGDAVLLMTDGLPELIGKDGEPFGYPAMQRLFGELASLRPQEMVERLAAAAEEWAGGEPPADDITFVALRVT